MKRIIILFTILFGTCALFAQVPTCNESQLWKTISDDDIVTISYCNQISTDKNGYHYVWVKAEYHWQEWQQYFSKMVGVNIPTKVTITKAQYTEDYNFAMVRQVLLFGNSGRKLYDSGDDRTAGWLPVNAGDPVGIVGEWLGNRNRNH